jgi:carboxymethylenebutenolidase
MVDTVEIPSPDGPIPAFSAVPSSQARGAIVVVQEAFGLTQHIGEVVDRLATEGFRAIAPAMYHRQGAPVIDYEALQVAEKAERLIEVMGSLTAEGLSTDVDATLAMLAGEGFTPEQIGMVGFCMGGAITLLSCTRPGIGAGVTFYGGGVVNGRFGLPPLVELAPSIIHPWLGLYGDQDPSIPVDEVEQLRASAGRAEVPTEVVRYEDAGHGFNCDARPEHFDAASAADGWSRMLAFFDAQLA